MRIPVRRPGRDADEFQQLAARFRAALPSATPWNAIGSAICQPTFFTGFRAFIAPWNTIAMSFQR